MTEEPTPGAIVDRLRANLQASGIPFLEADVEEILRRGYLRNVPAFEALAARTPNDTLPAYLGPRFAGAPEPGPLAGETSDADPPLPSPSRPVPPGLPWSGGPDAELRHASLLEGAALLRTGAISPVELTKQSLAAIERADPGLNAFQIVLAEEALSAARTAEREIAGGHYRGPLHGVPVAVKDLLTMRGTRTAAGSAILSDSAMDYDSAAVERLRGAGAVIVGKTRLSEFAYSPGSNNAHYGSTRNPWQPEHDTGGSSSGSGAAVAAGLVYAALGSDTGGSIRIPASLCGIVGLKPTFGRCSLHGAVPLSWSLDHLGPMARSVGDAALLLEVLAGHDPRDPRTLSAPTSALTPSVGLPPYLQGGVRGMRIGVLADDGSGVPLGTPEVLVAWRAGLRALEERGAILVELDLPEVEALRIATRATLVLEALAFHLPMLRAHLDQYGPFPRRRLLHGYGYGPLAQAQAGQITATLRTKLHGIFEQVDLLSTPTMPIAAPLLGIPAVVTHTAPFNQLGWPAISIPVGLTSHGLPLGLQLVGKPWDEATVLRAAYTLEQHGPWRNG